MSDWPFDPNAIPEELPPSRVMDLESVGVEVSAIDPGGTSVLLLSDPADREWAGRAAVELCAAWARQGRRVVIVDLHVETPLLSGGGNGGIEGIVDILLYGASLSRIATPAHAGAAYYLIPAGTYTSNSAAIFRHPRWRKLVAGFRDTGATLLLFAPLEEAGLDTLFSWTSEAILFGAAAKPEVGRRLSSRGVKVLGVLVPTPEVAAEIEARRLHPATAKGSREKGGRTSEAAVRDLPSRKARRAGKESHLSRSLLIGLLIAAILVAAAYVVLNGQSPEPVGAVTLQTSIRSGASPPFEPSHDPDLRASNGGPMWFAIMTSAPFTPSANFPRVISE